MAGFFKSDKFLDVGCDSGCVSRAADLAGFDAYGFDLYELIKDIIDG